MKKKKVLYQLLKLIGRIILFLFFKAEVKGQESIPKKGPLIVVANHISPMDPPLLGVLFPKILYFFAADDLFKIPLVGWIIRCLPIIPVNRRKRDFRSLKYAIDLLNRGESVAIFPQGGIPDPLSPKRYDIKPGAAYLSLKTGVPILCICISGTDKAIPRGKRFFRRLFVKIKIEYRGIVKSNDKNEIIEKIKKEIFACEDTYSRG